MRAVYALGDQKERAAKLQKMWFCAIEVLLEKGE